MKKIILILSTILTVSACCNSDSKKEITIDTPELTPQEQAFLNYKAGDSVQFLTNYGDTITMKQKTISSLQSAYEDRHVGTCNGNCSSCEKVQYRSIIWRFVFEQNKDYLNDLSYTYEKPENFSNQGKNRVIDIDEWDFFYLNKSQISLSVLINGKIYNNVRFVKNNTQTLYTHLDSLYYNDTDGILKITISNGNKWEKL